MTERLPMIGTPEFFQACAEADKTISGDNYTKFRSDRPVKRITQIKATMGYPAKLKNRALDLVLNHGKTCGEAAVLVCREHGIYVTRRAVKTWLWTHRKAERELKKGEQQ